ncbi:hypothetical protein PSPO01_15695 [Paraphaeosphaeria sporulosa]
MRVPCSRCATLQPGQASRLHTAQNMADPQQAERDYFSHRPPPPLQDLQANAPPPPTTTTHRALSYRLSSSVLLLLGLRSSFSLFAAFL